MKDVVIRLPWPPAATSANKSRQGDWRTKAKAARSYKDECLWLCKAQGVPKMDCSAVSAEIVYYPPRNGRLDWDNIGNRAKQGWDAVAEVIGIDDSDWWPVLSDRGEAIKNGLIEIRLRENTQPKNRKSIGHLERSMTEEVGSA